MAVGNPYGQNLFGAGPYARYDSTRPFGVGAYGTDQYSTWGGNTFDVGGATGIRFGARAEPTLTHQIAAATGITFSAAAAFNAYINPWAITGIVFSVVGHLTETWAVTDPCVLGDWQPAAPCEIGGWAPPPGCTPGAWTAKRLEDA